MPPASRRQQKYESRVRHAQNRNIAAGVVLFLVTLVVGWIVWILLPRPIVNTYVVFEHVNYGSNNVREIPFARENCELLRAAFSSFSKAKTTDPHEIASQNSGHQRPDKLKLGTDALIYYLNGHVFTQKDQSGQDEVYLKKPENESDAQPLLYWLGQFSDSDKRPGLTLVLLDAGQFSWSPLYPGRAENQFQNTLETKLNSDEWKNKLGPNFFVLVSHSPSEISLTSTPLKSSLFAYAIAETLKAARDNVPQPLSIQKFCHDVRERVLAYSRNFSDHALQAPLLLKISKGIITADPDDRQFSIVTINELITAANDPKEIPIANIQPFSGDKMVQAEDTFSVSETFSDTARTELATWYQTKRENVNVPTSAIQQLEVFLGFGRSPIPLPETSDLQQKDTDAKEFDIDEKKLKEKQDNIGAYRRATFDLFVRSRFLNHMYFWDGAGKEKVQELNAIPGIDGIDYDDDSLKTQKDSEAVAKWNSTWDGFRIKRENQDLVNLVRNKLNAIDEKPLTPLQAELIGVLSQRYLPLLETNNDADGTNGNSTAGQQAPSVAKASANFQLDLNHDVNKPWVPYWSAAAKRYQEPMIRLADDSMSDCLHRLKLSFFGSETAATRDSVQPDIQWSRIQPTIGVATNSRACTINRFHSELPIELVLTHVSEVKIEVLATDLPTENVKIYLDHCAQHEFIENNESVTLKADQQEFFVNFFVSDISQEQLTKEYQLRLKISDVSQAAIPVELNFNCHLSDMDALQVKSMRQLVPRNNSETVQMIPWPDTPDEYPDWKPLGLQTLPNIQAPFQFGLQNNSSTNKSLMVRLFSIQSKNDRLPVNFLPDRIGSAPASKYMLGLQQRVSLPGDDVFEDPSCFQLLGQTQIYLKSNSDMVTFELLPPPAESGEQSTAASNSKDVPKIANGLLLVLSETTGADSANNPSGKPTWYQFLQFEPIDPLDITKISDQLPIKLLPALEAELGIAQQLEKKKLAEIVMQNGELAAAAAKLTLFSNDSPFGRTFPLTLNNLLNGSTVGEKTDKPATLMIDVLGVPNFATYQYNPRQTNITNAPVRQSAVGVRITAPAGTEVYPNGWSFFPERIWDVTGIENNQTTRNIYVRTDSTQGNANSLPSPEVMFEFSLPLKGLSPLKDSTDFDWRWRDGQETFHFPIERSHHFELIEQQWIAWSTIKSHSMKQSLSSLANAELEVVALETGKTLGRWRLITRSQKMDPLLRIENSRLEYTRPAELQSLLDNNIVTLDLSDVQPPVEPNLVKLLFGEKGKPLSEFAKYQETANGKQVYRIPLAELGVDEKTKNGTISVNGTDFFGEPLSAEAKFTITKKPMAAVPKLQPGQEAANKPKLPVQLTLAFSAGEGKELEDIREFISISINGQIQQFGQNTGVVGKSKNVFVQRKIDSIVIHKLMPGEYSIDVTALVKFKDENAANKTAAGTVTVASEEFTETLQFK